MNRRHLSFHIQRGAGLIAPLLLAVGIACAVSDAAAKPKGKSTPTPTPEPTATVAPTPTPTPTPAPTASNQSATATYNGDQQGHYINMAKEAFVALRTAKAQPFVDAYTAFDAAGGVSAKGLTSKEAIVARRDLLAKTIASNNAYLEFVKTEEDSYRVELDKTPLVQGDVDTLVKQFDERTNLGVSIKLRATETEALKAGDDTLDFLAKKLGSWSVSEAGNITFKKGADRATMNELGKKYNAKATELQGYQKQLQAVAASASPTPGTSPAAVPGTVPTASVTPAPGPGATATPAASVKK